MKPSVDLPQLNDAKSPQTEVNKLVNQIRRRLNDRFRQVFTTSTAGTAATNVVYSGTMPASAVWTCVLVATARGRTLGHMTRWIVGTFARDGGAPAQIGVTSTIVGQTDMGAAVSFGINGNAIEWRIADDGTQATDWAVECSYQEIPRS